MNELCHQLIDYFNRTLTEDEMRQFEDHLTVCPSCQEELLEWQLLTEDLPYASDAVEVPLDLKARIFASIPDDVEEPVQDKKQVSFPSKNHRRMGVIPAVLAAGLFASLAANAYLFTEVKNTPEIVQSDLQLIGQTILASQTETDASAVAMLVADGEQEILLLDAKNLPALTTDQLYQVWVIEGGQPYPAGVVESSTTGTGSVSHSLKNLEGKWDTIAITIETEPNLPTPQGQIVLAGGI